MKDKSVTIKIDRSHYAIFTEEGPFRLYDIMRTASTGEYGMIMEIDTKTPMPGVHNVKLTMKKLTFSRWKFIRKIQFKVIHKVFRSNFTEN